jgi:hypothetical protein
MVKAIDLINEQKIREKMKEHIYKKIYKRIESKIVKSSAMNLYECWYQIPEFLFNVPLYNLEGCKVYLKNKLESDGFKIYLTGLNAMEQNIIVISWKH